MLLTSLCQLSAAEKQVFGAAVSCSPRYPVQSCPWVLRNPIYYCNQFSNLTQVRTIIRAFVYIAELCSFSDDLNALYVYESKMSLFIRIAQSRIGAERLLEANVVTVLAQSDFP